MKTELRVSPHLVVPGAQVFEIWYNGEFIGEVAGADGPGVHVISKYDKTAAQINELMLKVRIHR